MEERNLEGDKDGRGHNGECMVRREPDIRTEQYHAQKHIGTDYEGKDPVSKINADKDFAPVTGWSWTLE